MQLKVFSIGTQGGDEAAEELNRFLRGQRVAATPLGAWEDSRPGCLGQGASRLLGKVIAAPRAKPFSNDRRGRLSSLTAGTAVFLFASNHHLIT